MKDRARGVRVKDFHSLTSPSTLVTAGAGGARLFSELCPLDTVYPTSTGSDASGEGLGASSLAAV